MRISCRSVIEDAVQSLLQVSNLPSADLARALLLRAKGRFVAGYHTSARQDLHSASIADPENEDIAKVADIQAKCLSALSQRTILNSVVPEKKQDGPPHKANITVEVWQRIAMFLPRHDLTPLLLVSKAFSSVASDILSREIDLHLTTTMEPGEPLGRFIPAPAESANEDIEAWHNRRNTDLLTRILVDTHFVAQVRSLDIFAVSSKAEPQLAFKIGMLMNAIPKLFNLRRVCCSGNEELISRLLQTLHSYNPNLERLSLIVTQKYPAIALPAFKHLKYFSIRSNIVGDSIVQGFLGQIHDTLRGLSIKNDYWSFPTNVISVWNLTQIEFTGSSIGDVFMEVLNNGHQLESLKLSGMLDSHASSFIRQNFNALPLLYQLSLTITSTQLDDAGFCPALFEFLQKRTKLRSFHLFYTGRRPDLIGFNASVWASLSTLHGLHALSITYPEDLPPVMTGQLIPRTVRALTLDLSATETSAPNFFNKIGKNMPPDLRYICVIDTQANDIYSIRGLVERGFPDVSVARINGEFWTVTKSRLGPNNLLTVKWSPRRAKYHEAEWLDSLGCGDAIWTGVDE